MINRRYNPANRKIDILGGVHLKGKKLAAVIIPILVVLILAVTPFLSACPKTTQPTETQHLKVGVIMPLTGVISTVAQGWVRGFELYFDKLNAEGGVNIGGTQYLVDLIAEDSKLNPEAAVTAARKLIQQDKTNFIFGAIIDPEAEAISGVTAPAGVLHLITWVTLSGGSSDVSPDKPLAVRPMISSDSSIPLLIDYIAEAYPDAKTMAVTYSEMAWEPVIEYAEGLAAEHGIELLSSEYYSLGITDFVPVYTKVLASEPDIVFAMQSAQPFVQVKAARQLGFKGPFVSSSPVGPELFLGIAGAEDSKNVVCAGWFPGNPPTDNLKEILAGWKSNYGEAPFVSDSAFSWDAAWILVQALQKSGSIEPEKVVAAFDTMTAPGSLQTSFGPAQMGGEERFGVNRVLIRPIPITHIMDSGEVKFVGLETSDLP